MNNQLGAIAIGVSVLKQYIPAGAPIEEQLTAVFQKARTELWFTTDSDLQFRCGVGALLTHYGEGSPEWERLERELQALRYLSAGLVVGNLDRLQELLEETEQPEPIGIMKLWLDTDPSNQHATKRPL